MAARTGRSLAGGGLSLDPCQARSPWRRALAFLGPGYLVAVGYMDPGNWATSLAGGSKFGYTLLFVALDVEHHGDRAAGAVRAARHRHGARPRAGLPRRVLRAGQLSCLWVLAEIAICATDLAEVIGTAIGLNLLFGIPLEIGVFITALDVFLILYLQNLGFRWIEAFIITLLGGDRGLLRRADRAGRPGLARGDPRLRADGRDRHQSGDALSRARHPRRDRHAAQSLPALRRSCRRAPIGETLPAKARGAPVRHHRLDHRADVRAARSTPRS